MANKRQLKKFVRNVCGDLATEILVSSYCDNRINRDNVNVIVCDIADLQAETIAHCSFSFDKSARDFENKADYRKARYAYNRQAYKQLLNKFNEGVKAVVKSMNQALPAEVKEENKKAAAE
jgi:hypothetical protein